MNFTNSRALMAASAKLIVTARSANDHTVSFSWHFLLLIMLLAIAPSNRISAASLTTSVTISPPTPIAISGNVSPAGGIYSNFNIPSLSDAGHVSFYAGLNNGSSGGIFVGKPGSLQTAALLNSLAPSGGRYSNFSTPVVNNAGQVAIRSSLISGSSSQGLYFGTPGSMQTLARTNTLAPVAGRYQNFTSEPLLNSMGQVAFLADLTTPSTTAIFAGSIGSLQVVARTGTAAPSGGIYDSLGTAPVLNPTGKIAFTAGLTGGTSTWGLFMGTPGSLQAVVLQGTSAPTGGTFNTIFEPAINGAGQVAFFSTLTGGTSTGGIFTGSPGSLQTIGLLGASAPGGGSYNSFTNVPIINGLGQVAFHAALSGGTSSSGIFVGKPGAIQAVGRKGNSAPSGGNYDAFDFSVLNGRGQVAFTSTLFGPGVTATNDLGLYAGLPGSLSKVVRKGDVIDVDPGIGSDLRIVADINFANYSGGQDGDFLSFNEHGLIAYELQFTDGSSGIFTSVVPIPEPDTMWVLAIGTIGLWLLRHSRS